MGPDRPVLILQAVGKHDRTALILRHIHERIIVSVIRGCEPVDVAGEDQIAVLLVGTDADPVTAGPKHFAENTPEQEKENAEIRQSSMYNDKNRARIDNNQFFETRSNPLSSKGN